MHLLLYELKEKWDKKYLYVIYLFLLLIMVVYECFCYGQSDFVLGFQTFQRAAIVLFAGMMFLAYEIFCDLQKKEWNELFSLTRRGFWKIVAVKNLTMVIFTFAAFLIISLVTVKRVFSEIDACVGENVVRVLILNFALLPLMGSELGKMFALVVKKRWNGYLGILILILLSAGVFQRISQALFMTVGLNLDQIYRFFQFTQPNSDWIPDYLYLIPAENYRFFLVFAWIAGAEAIILFIKVKRHSVKVATVIICSFLCISSIFQVLHAGNYVNYNLNYGTAASKETEFKDDQLPDACDADFIIKKCSMELTITNELNADVVLELEKESALELHFTLYRGFEITDMSVPNDTQIQWERDKDYVTVTVSEPITMLRLSYHGYQQSFYSNSQGIMLPGYFAYYPQPGFRPVYQYRIVDDFQYYGFNMAGDSLISTYYEITIDASKPVVSNLQKKDEVYYGTTKVPTLMGGNVSKEERNDGCYIFPATIDISKFSLSDLKESLRNYCDLLDIKTEDFEKLKYVVVVPASVTIDDSWAQDMFIDDCLFLGSVSSSQNIEENAWPVLGNYLNVEGEKDFLKAIFGSVLKSGKNSYLWELEEINKKDFFNVAYDKTDQFSESFMNATENFTLDRMYLLLLKTFDNTEVLQKTAAFLADNEDQRSTAEFMQDLYRELEEEQNGSTNQ